MIAGWREDFNEGPYDYLAVRDGWEIFSQNGTTYRVQRSEAQKAQPPRYFNTLTEAKEYAYDNGCSRPNCDKGDSE